MNEAPFPCWKGVALALYLNGDIEELEIVQKKYLKGESATLHQYCSKQAPWLPRIMRRDYQKILMFW